MKFTLLKVKFKNLLKSEKVTHLKFILSQLWWFQQINLLWNEFPASRFYFEVLLPVVEQFRFCSELF